MSAPNEVRLRTCNPWIAVRNPRSSAAQSVGRIADLRLLSLRNWARGAPSVSLNKSKFLIHARAVLLPPSGLTIGKNGHILKTAKHMGGDSQWATARDALRAKACRDRGRRARWRVIHNSVRPPLASLNVVTAGKAEHEEGFFACVPFPHDLRVQGSKEKGR